jgi:hypothetical protein
VEPAQPFASGQTKLRATREAKVHGEEKASPNERSIDASRAAVLRLMAVRGPPLGFRADNTMGTYVTALPPPPYLYEPIYLCFKPCPSPIFSAQWRPPLSWRWVGVSRWLPSPLECSWPMKKRAGKERQSATAVSSSLFPPSTSVIRLPGSHPCHLPPHNVRKQGTQEASLFFFYFRKDSTMVARQI